jgi:hypothetical protein
MNFIKLFTIICTFLYSSICFCQSIQSVTIFCGSYASHGKNQILEIQSDGKLDFKDFEVNNQPSSTKTYSTTLTSNQMLEIYNKALEVQFFDLTQPKKYDKGMVDGSGVSLKITATDGTENLIEAYEYPIQRVDEIIKKINSFLPSGYQLDYRALH